MTRSVLCVGIDPDAASLPGRLPRDARRRRAVRAPDHRGVAAVRGRGQAEPRVLRGVRRGRASPRSNGCGRSSPPRSPSSRTRSAATSGRPPPARRSRCTTSSARTPSRSTRISARRPIEPLLERAGPLRLRPVPDVEPGRRRAPGPRRSPRIPLPAIPRSRSGRGSPAARRPGARAGPWVSSWVPRRPTEMAAIRALVPGLAFLVPGVGAQGGEIEPVLAAGPASAPPAGGRARRRPARQRVPGHLASRAGPRSGGRSARPRRAPGGGRRHVGRTARCATLTPSGTASSRRPGRARGPR